jgi:hypothetical protein
MSEKTTRNRRGWIRAEYLKQDYVESWGREVQGERQRVRLSAEFYGGDWAFVVKSDRVILGRPPLVAEEHVFRYLKIDDARRRYSDEIKRFTR